MDQTININPFNFLILSGATQSLIIAWYSLRKNRSQVYLSLGTTLVCFHIIYLMILDLNLEIRYPFLLWIPYSYITGLGPLIFLYTRSLLVQEDKLSKNDRLLFIPLLMEVIIQIIFIALSIYQDKQVYNITFAPVFTIITYVVAGVNIFYYLKKASLLLNQHKLRTQQTYSSISEKSPFWLGRLLSLYRLIWMLWIPFALLFFLFFRFQLQYLVLLILIYGLLLAITYLTYWIALENRTYADRVIPLKKERNSPNAYTYLTTREIEEKLNILDSLMFHNKIYLQQDLNLRDLAEKGSIEPNLVSFLLNTHKEISFFDYINRARVNEFKERVASGNYNHLTLLAIAIDCGFSSKSSFNRIFKKSTGMTPRQYQKTLE